MRRKATGRNRPQLRLSSVPLSRLDCLMFGALNASGIHGHLLVCTVVDYASVRWIDKVSLDRFPISGRAWGMFKAEFDLAYARGKCPPLVASMLESLTSDSAASLHLLAYARVRPSLTASKVVVDLDEILLATNPLKALADRSCAS